MIVRAEDGKRPEKKPPPPIDGAMLHKRRFYADILRGKSYDGGSLVDAVARAATVDEVKKVYEAARSATMSTRTLRRFTAAAESRIREIQEG